MGKDKEFCPGQETVTCMTVGVSSSWCLRMIACASQTRGGIGACDSLQHSFLQADYTLHRAFNCILLLCPLLVRGDLLLGSPLFLPEVLPDQASPEQKAREMLCKTVSPPLVPGTAASPVSVEADLLQHSNINKWGGSLPLVSQMCALWTCLSIN